MGFKAFLAKCLDWLLGPLEQETRPRPAAPSRPDPDLEARLTTVDEMMRICIPERVPLSLRYVDAKGEITERTIIPREWDGFMLSAYCMLRQAPRHFRGDRILELGLEQDQEETDTT